MLNQTITKQDIEETLGPEYTVFDLQSNSLLSMPPKTIYSVKVHKGIPENTCVASFGLDSPSSQEPQKHINWKVLILERMKYQVQYFFEDLEKSNVTD